MSGILQAVIIFLTIISAVGLGVFAAYATVNTILFAFAQSRQQTRSTPVLVPSQTHASGD